MPTASPRREPGAGSRTYTGMATPSDTNSEIPMAHAYARTLDLVFTVTCSPFQNELHGVKYRVAPSLTGDEGDT